MYTRIHIIILKKFISLLNRPMNPVWTPEKAEIAGRKQQYIGVPRGTRRHLLGAQNVWTTNRDVLYHTGYRITGTEQDIRDALMRAGINPVDIDNVIATSISANNYNTTMNDIYLQALQDENELRVIEQQAQAQQAIILNASLIPEKKAEIYSFFLNLIPTAREQLLARSSSTIEQRAVNQSIHQVSRELEGFILANQKPENV